MMTMQPTQSSRRILLPVKPWFILLLAGRRSSST
jgi:hypothetical protein